MRVQVKGRNVLVTGSSMGIGKGLSECFAAEGANLVLADHPVQHERLEEWAAELGRTYGIRTWTCYADLTESDGPEKLHEQVVRVVPEVHVLVNNAGICWFGRFSEMPMEKLNTMILLNCVAYAKMSRLFLPAMIERAEGGILNISSVSAFQPVPTLGTLCCHQGLDPEPHRGNQGRAARREQGCRLNAQPAVYQDAPHRGCRGSFGLHTHDDVLHGCGGGHL